MSVHKTIKDISAKHAKHIEAITLEQFEHCLLEAIKSGDFMRHVQSAHLHLDKSGNLTDDSRYAMTYLPYREKLNLQSRTEKLEAENKILKDAVEFYADDKDYSERGYHGYWVGFADDYSEAIQRIIEDDGKRAKEALEKIKEQPGFE